MLNINAAEEAIWHFIGLFQLSEETGRLRIDYDRFSALKTDPDDGEIEPLDVTNQFPYLLKPYLPSLSYAPPDHTPPEADTGNDLLAVSDIRGTGLNLSQSPEPDMQIGGQYLWTLDIPGPPDGGPVMPPEWPNHMPQFTLPVPGSAVVIATQYNVLLDGDRMDADSFRTALRDIAQIESRLETMVGLSDTVGVTLTAELPATEASFNDMAQAFRLMSAPLDEQKGVTSAYRTGDDTQDQYWNGIAVSERPDIKSLLPEFRKSKEDEASDEPVAATPTLVPGSGPANLTDPAQNAPKSSGPQSATEDSDQTEPAHQIVHGMNTLSNDASIVSAWIQAPVISASGDVHSYTVISQVNIFSDSDILSGPGSLSANLPAKTGTEAINLASHAVVQNPVQIATDDEGGPQYWVTATLTGSLVNFNWVDQYNLISDNDITSVTIHAEETLLVVGGNSAANAISLKELGFQYDIIIAGGNIIDINAILQSNVMLDDDIITIGESGAVVSTGDNLMLNQATIHEVGEANYQSASPDNGTSMTTTPDGQLVIPQTVLDDPYLKGLDIVRVLHVEDDLVSVNMVRQTNVLGDADQLEAYRTELAGRGETEIVTGSNVLVNSASIQEFGVDSNVYAGGEIYTDALLHQAELVSSDAPLMPDNSTALASEAVLFLAEGLIGDEAENGSQFRPIGSDQAISADAMDTILT